MTRNYPMFRLPIVLLGLVLSLHGADHAANADAPEAVTEVWSPVPPVVDAPPNRAPLDAFVLFDGTTLDAWEPVRENGTAWKIEDGAMVIVPSATPCDQRTKKSFGDVQLHVEWRTPAPAHGDGQDRGNSGIFFMGLYELQILDSYSNSTYVNGQAGAVYKEHAPLVNASRAPGEWQSYDVIFIAPRFLPDGALKSPARMTVFHNGVIIQHDIELSGPTPNGPTFHRSTLPPYEAHAEKLPLVIQDHRHSVAFRNIWIRELTNVRPEETWKPLFNGRNLDGWEMFMTNPDKSWNVPGLKRDADGKYLEPIGKNSDPLNVFNVEKIDGRPAIHITGQGFGVITTKASYANFHLRLEVKWGDRKWGSKVQSPRDSGLLYFVHGEPGFEHATWPRSIEFQIQEHDMGDLYALATQISVNANRDGKLWRYDPSGTPTLFVQKPPVGNRCVKRGDPEKPNGEWNTLDLFCFGDSSIHMVNGVVVMRLQHAQRLDGAEQIPLESGQISLQTEGAEVYFRDVEIRPINALPIF